MSRCGVPGAARVKCTKGLRVCSIFLAGAYSHMTMQQMQPKSPPLAIHPTALKQAIRAERTMVKKRVLDPIPVLDEALLSAALREEGIKEVRTTCGGDVDQQ